MTSNTNHNLLSQSYFDEIVEENEDVFDLSPEEAVVETIDQLYKQQQQIQGQTTSASVSLEEWKEKQRQLGLSLTHPVHSKQGQQDRQQQANLIRLLQAPQEEFDEKHVTELLECLQPSSFSEDHTDDSSDDQGCNKDDDTDKNKTNDEKIQPIPLVNLFWRYAGVDGDENQAAATAPESSSINFWTKLCAFAAASAFSFGLACQVALASLDNNNKLQRRSRQEQILIKFCIPSHGWNILFGSESSTAEKTECSKSQILWLQVIYAVCQGHEPNKKYCNTKSILQILVVLLDKTKDELLQNEMKDSKESQKDQHQQQPAEEALVEAVCRVVAVLCRFDDFSSQATKGQATDSTGMVVSSAHSTVTVLGSLGIVQTLHALLVILLEQKKENTKQTQTTQLQQEQSALLLSILQALRSLAIQDEMVVRMVSTGLLDLLQTIFQQYCSMADVLEKVEMPTAASTAEDKENNNGDTTSSNKVEELRMSILTALIGLYRNLSANDELKTTLCRSPQQSILGPLIASLQSFTTDTSIKSNGSNKAFSSSTLTKLQEHVCATLGSMALRQPQNAQLIVQEYQGHLVILKAMQMSQHSPLVQRQGALALRNLASRAITEDVTQSILDAGAEPILRQAATLGAVDEAYAALRDLGCHAVLLQSNPETGELERQPMFGEKPLKFNPVYD